MTLAATLDLSVTALVALMAVIVALALVLLVLILRTPRSHRIRVGFFVERDSAEVETALDEDTAEWPLR